MTDKRLIDLSYGRLGKPLYSPENGWDFAQDHSLRQRLQQLSTLKENLKSASLPARNPPESRALIASNVFKDLPDLSVAEGIAQSFAALDVKARQPYRGSVLAIGQALDVERLTSRKSTFPVIAMLHGEAEHVLRIVRPRVERRSWEKNDSTSLSLLSLDDGAEESLYSFGSGSPILQISFSDEGLNTGTWLAVRQDACITVLRLSYSVDYVPSMVRDVSMLNESRLVPTSIATLRAKTSRKSYVDVTFNPLYNRQVATIDQRGGWCVWEIEARHGKHRTPKLVAVDGKLANVLTDYDPDPSLRIPNYTYDDGWHKVLWVRDLKTIVVCSRTHLAVFDFQKQIMRLDNTGFMVAKGLEIIRDIRRSSQRLDHIFVLTSSKVYWLEVPALNHSGHNASAMGSIKVLQSYPHFRNVNDEWLQLATIQDEHISTFVYSACNSLINFYGFRSPPDQSALTYSSFQGTINVAVEAGADEDDFQIEKDFMIRGVCWNTTALLVEDDNKLHTGLGFSYHDRNVRFPQLFLLTKKLGISSTLFAAHHDNHNLDRILTPHVKQTRKFRPRNNSLAELPFIAPDWNIGIAVKPRALKNLSDDGLLVDWSHIFRVVFSNNHVETANIAQLADKLLVSTLDSLQEDVMTPGTLLELFGFTILKDNLDQIGTSLLHLLESLPNIDESASELTISCMRGVPGVDVQVEDGQNASTVLQIYQRLVHHWIAKLPLRASVIVRGSKFKLVRQIAVELGLSLYTLTLQSKGSRVKGIIASGEEDLEDGGHATRESSPATFYSAQASTTGRRWPESSFPTPTLTPSVYSQQTSASGVIEDPAISRLRQYALSIRPRPDTGKSRILSEWPSVPGVDPAIFTYKKPRTEKEEEDSERESARRKRDLQKRRKRTEKFLLRSTEPSRAVTPAGSQPPEPADLPFSSQPAESQPMTQPDRGTFGSRKNKGKKKQRMAGF